MKAPAFQFYARDFRASLSVAVMNSAQRGGYIMLLSAAWDYEKPGYLPNDNDLLRLYSGMTEDEWTQGKERLLKMFPATPDGVLRFNPRLLNEVEKQANYRESRSKGGKAAAEKRAAAQQNGSSENSHDGINPSHEQQHASIAPTLLSASSSASSKEIASKAGEEDFTPKSQSLPRPTGRPKLYRYDNAPIFIITEFFDYLRKQGYGHTDMGMYVQRIQEGARKAVYDAKRLKEEATNDEWKSYILNWLDRDKANGKLLLPDGANAGRVVPIGVTTDDYSPAGLAAKNVTKY